MRGNRTSIHLWSLSPQNFCHVTGETHSDSSFFEICMTDWETLSFPCHLFMKRCTGLETDAIFSLIFVACCCTYKYRESENEMSMKLDVFKQSACCWHRSMGKISQKPKMWKGALHILCFCSEALLFPGDGVAVDGGYRKSVISCPARALFLPQTPHCTLMEHTWSLMCHSVAIAKYLPMQKSLVVQCSLK